MRNRLLLIAVLALPLGACEALMNPDYREPAARPAPAQTRSVPSAAVETEPEDPSAPLEAGDVPTGTGAAAAAPSGLEGRETVGPRGELIIGGREAKLALTVFTNHACAYCRQFADGYLPRLLAGFVPRGELQVHVVSVPLQKYPNSRAETLGVLCAAAQGKGLAMHRALFGLSARTALTVRAQAEELGLDMAAYDACLTDPASAATADSHAAAAAEQQVTLVPSFRLGDGPVMTGLPEYADLRGMIEQRLRADGL